MSIDTNNESFEVAARRSLELESDLQANPERFRMLTGDRPTGPLHIGHLFGTLLNRVRMQDLGVDVFVLIADYQTITDRDAPAQIRGDVLGLVADYLAVGIDPERATIFAHSQIAELNQLMLPFLSLVGVGELQRNPTVKAEFAANGGPSMNALMFTYPVHQAADILFCRANVVPVGRDQLPHLELARQIARRFNDRYIPGKPYFPEPTALLSSAPLVLGLDGHKMSKSRSNAISLSMDEDQTARFVQGARTDSERRITFDPVHRPEVSNLLLITSLCNGVPPEMIAEEIGEDGSEELKIRLAEALNERLRPIRHRRRDLLEDPAHLGALLARGNERARNIATSTLNHVLESMHMRY
ncbi:MAG: tryptophan--tRNA ligase [Acidimicrobiaceae bacterium]|nr:tryptophan--tRNA ligase [Acidimicrobiaceae bacterium]